MRGHLCSRCGNCVGLSGGKIVFVDKEGAYRPQIVTALTEAETERILANCPGPGFNFPENRDFFFQSEKSRYNRYIGPYQDIFIGNATEAEVRTRGASGGIISAVLIHLLETGQIDGAVVLGMSDKTPWLSQAYIATTRDEIMAGAQSKYTIASVNEILPQIDSFPGKLAFVGLPPHVQGIRLLQRHQDPVVRNIKYIFGPYYGNSLHFSSIKSFLKTYGEKDYHAITRLYFRYGEWPGKMRIELGDRRVIEMKKFHANYLIPFHIMRNSLYCIDLANEFTDISGGDAWAPVYEERGKGFSMVIGRSSEGVRILQEMQARGLLELLPISAEESVQMHSHGYDLKKRGSFIRMKFRRWLGRPVPDWGEPYPSISLSRYCMEVVVSLMFLMMGTGLARKTVEMLPPQFIGNMFEKARTQWKKMTHDIKRDQL